MQLFIMFQIFSGERHRFGLPRNLSHAVKLQSNSVMALEQLHFYN